MGLGRKPETLPWRAPDAALGAAGRVSDLAAWGVAPHLDQAGVIGNWTVSPEGNPRRVPEDGQFSGRIETGTMAPS